MYRRNGDKITITLDVEKFNELLSALATATGAAYKHGAPRHARNIVRLCDAINEGNPSYTPYNLAPEPEGEPT
jgi:hypothetical protein